MDKVTIEDLLDQARNVLFSRSMYLDSKITPNLKSIREEEQIFKDMVERYKSEH